MRLDGRVDKLERAAARGTGADREAEVDALFAATPTAELRLLLAASGAESEGRPLTDEERAAVNRHAPVLARPADVLGG